MKTVKILSLTVLMSIFCAGMTFAQQQNQKVTQPKEQQVASKKGQKGQQVKATAEERAAKQVETMKTSLNLSNDQVSKLQPIQSQYVKDQDQARGAKKGNQQDWKTKKDAYNTQVKSILTPEQYQKWQTQRADMKKGQGKSTQVNQGKGNKGKQIEQNQKK